MEESTRLPLAAFQQWMQQSLLDPQQTTQANPSALFALTDGAAAVESVINHSERLSAQEHLAIYQRSYITRLRSCMAQQFSALEYALGEDLFQAFADEYLACTPSTHYNLAELGRLFPAYLQATRPDALSEVKEDWIDFVIELAAFEYELGMLFDRQIEEDYRLANIQDAEADLELVPTCTLFKFQFSVSAFYTQFKKGAQPALPLSAPSHCAVIRHDYKLAVYELPIEHYSFLELITSGMSIPQAKTTFSQLREVNAAAFIQNWPQWKQQWLKTGFFKRKPREV